MADENTEVQEQETQETTPQQLSIQFEDILPWGTTGGDTGLSSRLKLKRNFDKIKAWIDSQDPYQDLKYLSRRNDDTAAGFITFARGLASILTAFFGDYQRTEAHGGDAEEDSGAAILPDGTGDFIDLFVRGMVKGSLTVEQVMKAADIIFTHVLKSEGAREGFTDGHGIWMDALKGLIQTEGLEVRGFLRIMELIINRLQLMESDYSFTEGQETEHVDYTNDNRLLLTMHKRHDADYIPFYVGDIIYAKINDLIPSGSVPDGHTATRHGSYYTSWMVVDEVDQANFQMTVSLYMAQENGGQYIVPGGMNFTLYGTPIEGTDHPSVALTEEKAIVVDGHTLGETGFSKSIAITRHGNVANSSDPQILIQQRARQNSWVLSTTDQRISYFWRVDQPIIRDDNYALCLGILPNLANLPSTRDPEMPSLYINTIFYENMHHIYYPSRIIKEDRGAWVQNPKVTYTGPGGTWIPDGTLTEEEQAALGYGGTFATGQLIDEPYHFEGITRNTWLTCRLSPAWTELTDGQVLDKIKVEWHLDLETSRVWLHDALWECRVESAYEEPWLTSVQWSPVSTPRISLVFCDSDGLPLTSLPIRNEAELSQAVVPTLLFGQYDASLSVSSWTWERESVFPADDEIWNANIRARQRTLTLTGADFPVGWENGNLSFKCTARFGLGEDEQEIDNVIRLS